MHDDDDDGDGSGGRGCNLVLLMTDVPCHDVCIDHITMRLAIVAANYEVLATSVTFYDCTVHSSYVAYS